MLQIVLGEIYPLEFLKALFILEPLLFYIFLSDLFFMVKDVSISSYADNNTLYDSCSTAKEIILSLKSLSRELF